MREAEYLDSARLGYSNSLTGQGGQEKWASLNLTKIDEYNLHSLLMNNSEWVTGSRESFLSKKPIWKNFYVTKPNLLEVNVKDFFLAVNPVLSFQFSKESSNDETIFYNKRGITARGVIANRIGFSTTLTDNQERGPQFFQSRVKDLLYQRGLAASTHPAYRTDHVQGESYGDILQVILHGTFQLQRARPFAQVLRWVDRKLTG